MTRGFVALLLLAASPLAAQDSPQSIDSAIPDPATIDVPEIVGGRDAEMVEDGWKYYYFWRADTTFEQAYADFSDCYRFLPAPGNALLDGFVTWQGREAQRPVPPNYSAPYGIVGAAIGALLATRDEDRGGQSRMRRCLEPRGYQRFPVARETWGRIIDGFSPNSIAVSAKLASGPRPDAEPVPEDR